MYYPRSENKGADQLRGYREADQRLCFRIGKNLIFSFVVYILVYFVTVIVVLGGHFTNDGRFLARKMTDSPEPTQTNNYDESKNSVT